MFNHQLICKLFRTLKSWTIFLSISVSFIFYLWCFVNCMSSIFRVSQLCLLFSQNICNCIKPQFKETSCSTFWNFGILFPYFENTDNDTIEVYQSNSFILYMNHLILFFTNEAEYWTMENFKFQTNCVLLLRRVFRLFYLLT